VIRGVPTRTWKSAPPTLRTVLELSAGHGDETFLVYEDERLTFGEHFRLAAGLSNVLIERYGVQKGDRVAIAMRNLPEWVIAFWAAIAAGAIVVPVNAWWTGPELAYGLDDSGTSVVFVDEERKARILPTWGDPLAHGHGGLLRGARSRGRAAEGRAGVQSAPTPDRSRSSPSPI